MKKAYPVEFVYQIVSLILAIIVVHSAYVLVVRPNADTELARQTAMMQANPDFVPKRSVWVIIRDFEQEACFILGLWALAIMAFKAVAACSRPWFPSAAPFLASISSAAKACRFR